MSLENLDLAGENYTGKIISHESIIENSLIEAKENEALVIFKKIGCEIKKPTTVSSIWKDGKKVVEKGYQHIILKLGYPYGIDGNIEKRIILPEELQKALEKVFDQVKKEEIKK